MRPVRTRSRFVTGKLADLIRWGNAAQTDWRFEDRTVDVRKVDSIAVEGASARADLDAEERVNLVQGDFREPMSMSYTGPLRLELVDGVWKVADYAMNGSSICDRDHMSR